VFWPCVQKLLVYKMFVRCRLTKQNAIRISFAEVMKLRLSRFTSRHARAGMCIGTMSAVVAVCCTLCTVNCLVN
jgi:hypothetical protein